ncbi:glycosyltransferase [Pedobacter sp. PF22-3]|uniref:glycosyltransferase family protein n=1 Tax=Pedobacter sp. PF22-3 TaxID=2994467 RepID=UPI0022473302|nr:glycosyltransferase [Pedobacter sp. PF22-3]MCX2492586.1 glycosyltransferase [Pedobacter sp. PF22-3]
MKIFLSFLQSNQQHPIAAYSFWEYYIKNGIEEAGYKWIECQDVDWAKGLVSQSEEDFDNWKSASWEKTLSYVKENRPDLFLSYLYPEQVDKQAIQEIKKLGILCVNFFCDNVRLFKKAPKAFDVFDLNWVPEQKAIPLYQQAAIPCINLPMPMWIEPKYRTPTSVELDVLSFIGSKDIQRQLFFEKLLELNPIINLDIYGSGWAANAEELSFPRQSAFKKLTNQFHFLSKHGIKPYLNKLKFSSLNPPISSSLKSKIKGKPNFENYIKITRQSKITIGINRYPSFNYPLHQPNTYSRLRDIEAPMLGACYLTEWTYGMDELYDLDTEILSYITIEEFQEKSQRLVKDKQLRVSLRSNGQKRALADHSIPASLRKIIK